MKRMLLCAAVAVLSLGAFAQNENLPKSGDISTEIQFNPFTTNYNTFKVDQLKVRFMVTNKDAVRVGLGFGIENNKNSVDTKDAPNDWTKNNAGNVSLNLGYERHFLKSGRVDLYAGAGLGFEYAKRSNITSAVMTSPGGKDATVKTSTTRPENEFNVQAFTGIDFYVYKGLYVGAEFGVKFATRNVLGGTAETFDKWDGDKAVIKKVENNSKDNTITLAVNVVPALRLGWTF